ncbi:MAG TPA: hypothetical protein VGD81_12015 [Opitutaceae bacterium]
MKPPFSPEPVWSSTLLWPTSLTALRQLFPGRRAEPPAAPVTVVSAATSAAPSPATRWTNSVSIAAPPEPRVVPPSEPFPSPPPPRGNFRIQCLPLGPATELSVRVKAECDQLDALGYALVSSFSHDGHAFLIFKRK